MRQCLKPSPKPRVAPGGGEKQRPGRAAMLAVTGCLAVAGCVVPSLSLPGLGNLSEKPSDEKTTAAPASFSASPTAIQMAVNGEIIEATDIWTGMRDQLRQKHETLAPAAYRRFLIGESAAIIANRIADALLYTRASLRHPPEASERMDGYINEEIRKIVSTQYGAVQRRYEQYLQEQGQSLDDIRSQMRRKLIVAVYLDSEIKPKLAEPTRADLWKMFQDNIDTWNRPARRRLSLIEVRVLDRLPEDWNNPTREQMTVARHEARARIEAATRKIKEGIGFAEVAREYSDGLSAAEGGAWNWVSRDGARKRFEPAIKALYALQAGEVSDILEGDDGFFLVRCDEVDPGSEPNFQIAQPELLNRYSRRNYDKRVHELIEKLRRDAHIEPADLSIFHRAVVEAAINGPPNTTQ